MACIGDPGSDGMKVNIPVGEGTVEDTEPAESAQAGAERREAS